MDGFTYRGKHCEAYDCFYIPSESNIGLRMEDYTVESAAVTGRDGSYHFGTTVKERAFELECYFEEISKEKYAKILEWLRRDKSGEQVFDDRPYVTYTVRPVKPISPKLYVNRVRGRDVYSGTFTINFVANDPFGKMSMKSLKNEYDYDGAMSDTGIILESMMPPAPKIGDQRFMIYNCGTEKAHTIIRIAGRVDPDQGQTIENTTNGTSCRLIGLDSSAVPNGAWIEIDSETGRVYRVLGDDQQLAFEFHDLGYLRLEPCGVIRDLLVRYKSGERNIRSDVGAFGDVEAGQYIYLNGSWRYIGRVIDPFTLETNVAMEADGAETTCIATMNNIELRPAANLTKLEIDFTPLVR